MTIYYELTNATLQTHIQFEHHFIYLFIYHSSLTRYHDTALSSLQGHLSSLYRMPGIQLLGSKLCCMRIHYYFNIEMSNYTHGL